MSLAKLTRPQRSLFDRLFDRLYAAGELGWQDFGTNREATHRLIKRGYAVAHRHSVTRQLIALRITNKGRRAAGEIVPVRTYTGTVVPAETLLWLWRIRMDTAAMAAALGAPESDIAAVLPGILEKNRFGTNSTNSAEIANRPNI